MSRSHTDSCGEYWGSTIGGYRRYVLSWKVGDIPRWRLRVGYGEPSNLRPEDYMQMWLAANWDTKEASTSVSQ